MAGLSPAQRRALKARAHALDPVVRIGDGGLSDAVAAEIDRALNAHELIKVRAGGMDRVERALALAAICERTGAEAVQAIGKVMVLWREKREDEATRSERPGSRSASPRPVSAPKPARRRSSRSARAR
jgi:RNA-binding protein